MKIGVLSDTHIRSSDAAISLSERLLNGPFSGVDAIIHAGDAVMVDLEKYFAPLPWFAVRGNMDLGHRDVPISRTLLLQSRRIGLIHGWGSPVDIEKRVMDSFAAEKLDALVFGHSHMPVCRKVGGMLLFNPGSPTDRRSALQHTVGILTVGTDVCGQIIPLD